MDGKIKVISTIFVIIITYLLLAILFQNTSLAVTQSISSDIEAIDETKYPGIKDRIKLLQSKYPNWKFKILYTGLEWNTVIANEFIGHGTSPKNLVYKSDSYKGEWICPICGDKGYDNGSWKCASEQAIKYMMDPRNSINASDIFQFEELTDMGCDVNTLKTMTNGTFLSGHEQGIIDVSKSNKVNAYYIVARLIQEQGRNGSALTSGNGYNGINVGYYNAFNIAASGNSPAEIIQNALQYAKNKNWNTLEASIDGGINFVAKQYIQKGQNTLYLQKFDVEATNGLYANQYMQNILAAQNEGTSLRKAYTDINTLASSHTFIIPVYENMPSDASPRPNTNGQSSSTSDIVKVNVTNTLRIRDTPNGNGTKGYLAKDEIVTRLEKATTKVAGTYWDKIQKANGIVGYVARETYDYESSYKLYLVPVGNESSNGGNENSNGSDNILKGDVNNDGKITSSDYVLIKNYIMGTQNFDDRAKSAADMNNDGKITSSDYVLVKNYIMNN